MEYNAGELRMKKTVFIICLSAVLVVIGFSSFKTIEKTNAVSLIGKWNIMNMTITYPEDDFEEFFNEGSWDFRSNGTCTLRLPQTQKFRVVDATYDLYGNELTVDIKDGEDDMIFTLNLTEQGKNAIAFSGTIRVYDRHILQNKVPYTVKGKLKK